MKSLGHACAFACELDAGLADLYEKNFGIRPRGDLRTIKATEIPSHDVLCAGFPCQPFSKAGEQLGTKCKLWGDLFSGHVLRVLRAHRPTFLIMENVANLERHNAGQTWASMRQGLQGLGYEVRTKVLSPHRFGIPQIRERLFIVGSRVGLDHFEWPKESTENLTIASVLQMDPPEARKLPTHVVECLDVWQDFIARAPKHQELPSFPIWTMEFGATYPYTKYDSLTRVPLHTLRKHRGSFGQTLNCWRMSDVIKRIPSYARGESDAFPHWKQLFIKQNREYYSHNKEWIKPWLPSIRRFAPSLQKLEWNCRGEPRNIWRYVIQFRASGVRIKRTTTAPSLVAMTTTQVPIIAWQKRYMTPRECSRLQSMDHLERLPTTQNAVYKALGNAVNVEVVRRVASRLCNVNGSTTGVVVA